MTEKPINTKPNEELSRLESAVLFLHLQFSGHRQFMCPWCCEKKCEFYSVFDDGSDEIKRLIDKARRAL